MPTIAGTIPMAHNVDASGSFTIDVPLQLPECRFKPVMSLFYHSGTNEVSSLGQGWTLMGVSTIKRVPATIAQDGVRGSISYNTHDRFALDGNRLIKISDAPVRNKTEYRFEIEQWSRVFAIGELGNPTSWEQYLPDGTIRKFGATNDSNIKKDHSISGSYTRVWAICEASDPFTNYITFKYSHTAEKGTVRISEITYGGNTTLELQHQRKVTFQYESRNDTVFEYLAGSQIVTDQRLKGITCAVNGVVKREYALIFDYGLFTDVSRLKSITLFGENRSIKVEPLTFEWSSWTSRTFGRIWPTAKLDCPADQFLQIIPMDVDGKGFTDLVLVSKGAKTARPNNVKLCLEVHLSHGEDTISNTPDSQSFIDLDPPGLDTGIELLPFDANGNGKTDLLHICPFATCYSITMLHSSDGGFVKKPTLSFTPPAMDGAFRLGDFKGDGRIELVYIYLTNEYQIRFIQFTSDGTQLTAGGSQDGPHVQRLPFKHFQIVVGDLTGDGADDIFLVTPEEASTYVRIDLLLSVNGKLEWTRGDYLINRDRTFIDVGTTVLPFRTEYDDKTSLLLASKNPANDNLRLQILRSTGRGFIADQSPFSTDVKYDSKLTITKVISQTKLDIVMIADAVDGPEIHIVRFDGQTFKSVPGHPKLFGFPNSILSYWADIRGIGLADFLFAIHDSGKIVIRNLDSRAAVSSDPVDRIVKANSGLGASVTVLYAALTDHAVYSSRTVENRQPTAFMNGRANRSVVTTNPSDTEFMRSRVAPYPSFVTRMITILDRGHSHQTFSYTYANALIDFTGRGWLGFETINKSFSEIHESTSYLQNFPFVGQISRVRKYIAGNITLQTTEYTWRQSRINNNKNVTISVENIKETYYEGAQQSYNVDVTFNHDNYGNIIKASIVAPHSTLCIKSSYQAPSSDGRWVVGNKTAEDTIQGVVYLRRFTQRYDYSTFICNGIKNWIADETWSSTAFDFDQAGNKILTRGPSSYRQEITYDDTFSTIESTATYTDIDHEHKLIEATTFDLTTSRILQVTSPNGVITHFEYDVLGRKTQVSQGTNVANLDVMEKTTFSRHATEQSILVETRRINTGKGSSADGDMRQAITFYDGLLRPISVRKSCPDRLDTHICVDTSYDGLGQVITRTKEYLSISQSTGARPGFKYDYDKNSRLIKEEYPSHDAQGSTIDVIRTIQYSHESGVSKISETLSDGTTTQTVTRKLVILANADSPTIGNFVKLCVEQRTNEVGQLVSTTFDGLARPTKVMTPTASGVELLLEYDGLSRQTRKKVQKTGSSTPFSHFSLTIDDSHHTSILFNEITQKSVTTKTDICQRVVSKSTSDEGGFEFAYHPEKGQLLSVSSDSSTTKHTFTYDARGNQSSVTIEIDGFTHKTVFEKAITGQLTKLTNPDNTTISPAYFADGLTLQKISLSDPANVLKAMVEFSELEDVYAFPKKRKFGVATGDQITSSIFLFSHSGMVNGDIFTKGTDRRPIMSQSWHYDNFNKITNHRVDSRSGSVEFIYQYDLAGHLMKETIPAGGSTEFKYDAINGDIEAKGDVNFTNDGWQIANPADANSFEYTSDGNLKKAGSNMTYDAEGRLSTIDGTIFLYDYTGRLLKATAVNGDVTYYVSPTYEITLKPASGQAIQTSYMLYNGQRRASYTPSRTGGDVYYFHTDHLGSTIAVSNSQGTIVTRYQYDAFGNVRTVQGNDIARYKYCGKELFVGDVYYFGSRFYDPKIGRFLTLDKYPVDLDNISPSCFNLYLFARNDPINLIDIDGNAAVPVMNWFADVSMIAIGLAMIAGGGPIPGGVILGMGISGLAQDISSASNDSHDDSAWGVQLVLGGAFGLVGSGAGSLVTSGVRHGSRALLPHAVRQGGKHVAFKATYGVVSDTSIGAVSGVGQQVVTNAINGDPLGKDIETAAILGGASAFFLTGGISLAGARLGRLASRAAMDANQLGGVSLQSVMSGMPNMRAQMAKGRISSSAPLGIEGYFYRKHTVILPYMDE